MDREPLSDNRPDAVTSDDALECYRPGRDDPHDSQLAPLAARLASDQRFSQRLMRIADFDRSVQAAFVDVNVPPDLAANILIRLNESAATAPVKVTVATVKMPRDAKSAAIKPSSRRPQISRRRTLFALAGFAGTVAAILLGVVWALQRPHAFTPSSLLEEAITTFAHETAIHPEGALVSDTPPPSGFPFSTDLLPLRTLRATRWRNLSDFLGSPAVAYDLPSLNGARATLYVSRANVPSLMPYAPNQPTGNTGGCSAGAWEVEGTLYVLVVEGDNRAYRSYLDLSHGPIA